MRRWRGAPLISGPPVLCLCQISHGHGPLVSDECYGVGTFGVNASLFISKSLAAFKLTKANSKHQLLGLFLMPFKTFFLLKLSAHKQLKRLSQSCHPTLRGASGSVSNRAQYCELMCCVVAGFTPRIPPSRYSQTDMSLFAHIRRINRFVPCIQHTSRW